MTVAEAQTLRIADGSSVQSLDYAQALAFHGGESWFGVAVAFRMLQAVAPVFSTPRLWDRNTLAVVSRHPGGGVRDAIDYVTHCVRGDRFRLETDAPGCGRGMQFYWRIDDGRRAVTAELRTGFVPETFYQLLDRRGSPLAHPDDSARLTALKQRLAEQLWQEPLAGLFRVDTQVADHA